MPLGEPGYDELWAFADLRGREYASGRLVGDDIEEVRVAALVIAHQPRNDGAQGGFLLVELDEDAEVISDWVESTFDEAKEHGEARANREHEGLQWDSVPDTGDVRRYIRERLRSA